MPEQLHNDTEVKVLGTFLLANPKLLPPEAATEFENAPDGFPVSEKYVRHLAGNGMQIDRTCGNKSAYTIREAWKLERKRRLGKIKDDPPAREFPDFMATITELGIPPRAVEQHAIHLRADYIPPWERDQEAA